MFRLTLLLCAGLFAVMYIGGEDRGQIRFGLVAKTDVAVPVAAVAPAPKPIVARRPLAIAAVSPAAMAPDKPIMAAAVAVATPPAEVREENRIMTVIANSANVRGGPGIDYSVMGRLTRGETVLVLADADLPEGWSHIRVEGDGIDGFIATRLLAE